MGECIFWHVHVKCGLFFRKDKTKVKTQIVDILLRELVYIRLLQLGMHIFRLVMVNSPAAPFQKNLFEEPPLYGEFDAGGRLKWRANSDNAPTSM